MILHEVVTTEKVPFHYRVAGMGARLLAWLVDCGVIVLLGFAGALAGAVLDMGRPGLGSAVALLWFFCLQWGYFLVFEWLWQGQTPGKRLLGIRVVEWRGTSLSFFQAAVRNLLRFADWLPACYGLGFVVAACNREHRRLGDLAAGTLVVHVERKARPIRALFDGGGGAPGQELLVRQRLAQLSREQQQAVLDLCLRRDQLRLPDRARLFRVTADYLRGRLDVQPEEHVSDEKFVLRLAALLGGRGPEQVRA